MYLCAEGELTILRINDFYTTIEIFYTLTQVSHVI